MKLTREIANDLLRYNILTGDLTWRNRSRVYFKSDADHKGWNTKYEGEPAGHYGANGRAVGIFGKLYQTSRVFWLMRLGRWPLGVVDHINGDKSDERWINLRDVSNQENCKNQSMFISNSSGTTGVRWAANRNRWRASIRVNGKTEHLEYFTGKDLAITARKAAEVKYNYHPGHGLTPQERKRIAL